MEVMEVMTWQIRVPVAYIAIALIIAALSTCLAAEGLDKVYPPLAGKMLENL